MKRSVILFLCILLWTVAAAEVENDPYSKTFTGDSTYWEVLPDMPNARTGAYVGYYYDPGVDTATYIHAFGGYPGPSADHYVWDGNSWTVAGDPLPVASGYGGHCTIDNRIYMVGGMGAGNVITIYEPGAGYTTVTLPQSTDNNAVCVGQDRYIYSIGGGQGWNPTTMVILYDIEADSFLPVTQLPASQSRTCACAGYFPSNDTLVPDTIIVASGYDFGGGTTTTTLGVVWPSDPGNITWMASTPIPGEGMYRASSGVWQNNFFIIGGGYFTQMFAYIPGSGWLYLGIPAYTIQNAGCTMAQVQVPGGIDGVLYICGGAGGSGALFLAYHTGMIISAISEQPQENVASTMAYSQIIQNPVTDCARILYFVPVHGSVRFKVFDAVGRMIVDQRYSSITKGEHSLTWDCTDRSGQPVPSGVYMYRLETEKDVLSGQITVVR
jgi:hypothetical protein